MWGFFFPLAIILSRVACSYLSLPKSCMCTVTEPILNRDLSNSNAQAFSSSSLEYMISFSLTESKKDTRMVLMIKPLTLLYCKSRLLIKIWELLEPSHCTAGPPLGLNIQSHAEHIHNPDSNSPSSDPVMMMGSSGWKLAQDTFWACPSRVCTQVLFWNRDTESHCVPLLVNVC